MSFSVDDLVSSLSSSHIGQEAMDLAALQTQLAEALLGGPVTSATGYVHGHQIPSSHMQNTTQACNTPIARTPSLSSSFSHSWVNETVRKRANSISSTYMDDMEEDEKMVEDLLIPSSPTLSSVSGSQFGNPSASFSMTPHPHIDSNVYPSYENLSEPSPSPTTSLFTSTDPFYIAQLQASNSPIPQSQSVFAQNGRLTQNSPFAVPQYHPFHSHGQIGSTPQYRSRPQQHSNLANCH
ncbi:hypothetical protein CPB84DRAFT_1852991 [Gymnopilus junonius]|uniref:Uncharacterized protein n=1 Tax=Gymnopilus junonius TaxID=109634 RepID=A0A9P5TGW8_GYMJU|nr:hypothetical protein CPB84DRAFT_1852991 [Gymnopilus junonius]